MVISNSLTEERKYLHASNPIVSEVTFSRTPELVVGMFPTTYHYFNTIDRGQAELTPIVVTSKHTIVNTITRPGHLLTFLHTTKELSPTINTYFSKILLTKTVYNGFQSPTYVTSKNNLTQVVITESTPAKIATYIYRKGTHCDSILDKNTISKETEDLIIYSTTTLLETLTYCSTMFRSSLTGIQVASYIDTKRTVCKSDPRVPTQHEQLLTHVMKNIVTNTVSSSLFNSDLLVSLKSELMLKRGKNQRPTIVTMATLLGGEIVQVTAMNIIETPDTLNSTEKKLYFSSKQPNYSKNISKISEKTALYMNPISEKNNTDLSSSESENSEIYIKDSTKPKPGQYISFASSQVSASGNVNLERFRPMLNVVAHLLKKQFNYTQNLEKNHQTFTKETKNNKAYSNKGSANDTLTISATMENPVYIPLQQNESGTSKIKYLNSRVIEQENADSLGKLRINSLHIYPPKMDVKKNFLRATLAKMSYPRNSVDTAKVYNNVLVNTGIPIRPGEVITASANVIFGRPRTDISVSRTKSNGNTTSYHHSTELTSLYSGISFQSTMLHNSLSNNKRIVIEYASILKPPPLPVNKPILLQYPSTFQSQLDRTVGSNRFSRIDLVQKYSSIDRHSSHPAISLNSAFYSNQILDIFRNPQIFVTNLPAPASKNYASMSNTFDYSILNDCTLDKIKPTMTYRTPLIASTFTALQQVNMKNDVLSHTVNMHARPLTFKRESENIPYATAVRGHINSFLLNRIKIPISDAKIDIQLTHNHKRLFPVEYKDVTPKGAFTKTKLQNVNLINSKNDQHGFSFENMKKQIGINKYTSFYRNEFPSQFSFNLISANDSFGTYSKPTMDIHGVLHEKVKQGTVPDQKSEHSNESLNFVKFNLTKKYDHTEKTVSNKLVSLPKSNEKRTKHFMSSYKQLETSNSNKGFQATGEQFHIGPFTEYTINPETSKMVPRIDITSAVHSTPSGSLHVFERPQLRSISSKESKSLKFTSNDDLELKTFSVKTISGHQYRSIIPVTNGNTLTLLTIREPLSESNKIMNGSTLGTKCQFEECKNNLLKAVKDDIKILEPSEMLQDENSSVSKKTMEWDKLSMHVRNSKTINHLISTSTYTRNTTNYFNILKPTKSKSIGTKNLSAIVNSFDVDLNNMSIGHATSQIKDSISIRLQKVLTSLRTYKQSQISQMSKHFKESDYLVKPSKDIIGNSSSRAVDIIQEQNSLRYSKNFDSRNDSSNLFISDSNADGVSYASSESNSVQLVDSLAQTNYSKIVSAGACHPPCRSNKNEICVTFANYTGTSNVCECRPSFGRMFPDRPCKPTYTYEMKIQAYWAGNHSLKPFNGVKSSSTVEYRHINRVLLEAADRMVMQSDYRDIFHGVQLRSFFSEKDTLTATFLLQLSENSDEYQLASIFKRYLRQSNFSIGGTGFYTPRNGQNVLAFKDFDECGNENYNDCSIDAHCFNLIGSYTCSCKEGYVDTADNALYPGRHCSENIIGCDWCNFKGKCINESVDKRQQAITTCKCYSWYAGTKCQVNLKIIMIFLFTSGTILSTLFLFFYLLIKSKHGNLKASQLFAAGSHLHPSIVTSTEGCRPTNRRKGSKSEFGQCMTAMSKKESNGVINTNLKHVVLQKASTTRNCKALSVCNLCNGSRTRREIEEFDFSLSSSDHGPGDKDQTDRSLTLMIPRAKFRIFQNSFLNHNAYRSTTDNEQQSVVHKDDVNLSACRPTAISFANRSKCSTLSDKHLYRDIITQRADLVSAGFEVSAVVTDKSVLEIPILHDVTSLHESFDVGENRTSSLNEDANTMTERDLGSTFLLPHTHLYKPDKIPCDLSGFSSL
ncbi:uncharacterized protein LOC128263768 [Drosophila gunungcola]|nr:uncharacterized protein LOC128263768 [Drosophila gunungcola]